jgi:HD-like signal output (HDOD) protein
VAAISFALASRIRGFDRDDAQLAGLLHDIGMVSVLGTASGGAGASLDLDALWALARRSRADTGAMILEAWNFPAAQVVAVRDAEQWWRDDSQKPELADLVMVAQLMSLIGKPGFLDVPPLVRLPAYRKLFPEHGSPELVMELLEDAREQMAEIRALLKN